MSIKAYVDALDIIQDFIPVNPNTRPQIPIKPTFITIHNTANNHPGANAAAHNRYIRGREAMLVRKVSWHFTVDDGAIFYHVPVNEKAMHAGSGNARSLGVEICMYQGMDAHAAYLKAASLVAYLCKSLKINPGNIVQHHGWTGKNCPIVLRTPSSRWDEFLAMVKHELGVIAQLPQAFAEANLDDSTGVPLSFSTNASVVQSALDRLDEAFTEMAEEDGVGNETPE